MLYRLVNIHLFVSQAAIFFTADRINKAGGWRFARFPSRDLRARDILGKQNGGHGNPNRQADLIYQEN